MQWERGVYPTQHLNYPGSSRRCSRSHSNRALLVMHWSQVPLFAPQPSAVGRWVSFDIATVICLLLRDSGVAAVSRSCQGPWCWTSKRFSVHIPLLKGLVPLDGFSCLCWPFSSLSISAMRKSLSEAALGVDHAHDWVITSSTWNAFSKCAATVGLSPRGAVKGRGFCRMLAILTKYS